ncbi:hypothetical protein Nepgr_027548 [Nepenthes gracilis]|uniref:Uncharacterized protein n=1 Tax=Nepenthes gracilis TaxID=150966 RepID=A0AAD3TA17_NEPGR|nr:hypothetical protein Nepgr_027548 [Nepenthes gracilis]
MDREAEECRGTLRSGEDLHLWACTLGNRNCLPPSAGSIVEEAKESRGTLRSGSNLHPWESVSDWKRTPRLRQRTTAILNQVEEQETKLSVVCERVLDRCLAPSTASGEGCDNMTMILVQSKKPIQPPVTTEQQQAIDEPQELPSSSAAAGDADLKHEEPEIKLMLKMNPFLGQQELSAGSNITESGLKF